ncbi:MAG: hypothetical protein K9L75_04480 [Spirochaetia bacterium]|nr:hypothetical protein [Spirochaetia bacterium]
MAVCYFCGSEFPEKFEVYRTTSCPSCGRDVKICRNCAFYSPGSHYECRETISEPVRDKERANFCDYFRLASSSGGSGKDSREREAERKKAKQEEARRRFNSLFGD